MGGQSADSQRRWMHKRDKASMGGGMGGGGGALCTLAIPGGPVWRPGLASAASYTPLVPTLYRVAREPELCGLPARETLVFPVCGGEPPNYAHAHARQKQKPVMLMQMNSLHMLTNSLHIQTNSLNVLETAGAQIVPGHACQPSRCSRRRAHNHVGASLLAISGRHKVKPVEPASHAVSTETASPVAPVLHPGTKSPTAGGRLDLAAEAF